jgi:hypothetical protein
VLAGAWRLSSAALDDEGWRAGGVGGRGRLPDGRPEILNTNPENLPPSFAWWVSKILELLDQSARTVSAFEARRPLVAGVEAPRRIIVYAEAECSLREGREIPLHF